MPPSTRRTGFCEPEPLAHASLCLVLGLDPARRADRRVDRLSASSSLELRRVGVPSRREPDCHAGAHRRTHLAMPASAPGRQARLRLRLALAPLFSREPALGRRRHRQRGPRRRVPPGAHLRVRDPSFAPSAANFARIFLVGLASGISVALLEETVFRGVMHTAVADESGPWAAALLTAPLFAILHFFAKARIPAADVGWSSGFHCCRCPSLPGTSCVGARFLSVVAGGRPDTDVDAVLTGNIAAAIGCMPLGVVLRMLQESTTTGASAAIPCGWAASTAWWATGCCLGNRHRRGGVVHSRAVVPYARGASTSSL